MMTPALRTDRFNTLTFFKFSTSSRWCSCIILKLYLEFQTLKAKIAAREAKRKYSDVIPSYDVTSTAHKNSKSVCLGLKQTSERDAATAQQNYFSQAKLHISILQTLTPGILQSNRQVYGNSLRTEAQEPDQKLTRAEKSEPSSQRREVRTKQQVQRSQNQAASAGGQRSKN